MNVDKIAFHPKIIILEDLFGNLKKNGNKQNTKRNQNNQTLCLVKIADMKDSNKRGSFFVLIMSTI